MFELTTTNIALSYLSASYLAGLVWFLIIERSDGLLKWRALATAFAPVAVPLMVLVGVGIAIFEKMTFTPKTKKVRVAEPKKVRVAPAKES